MIKYFKIFILVYDSEYVPGGYSTKHLWHPIYKAVSDYDLDQNFDSIEEAESALKQHGKECNEYVIQPIYKIES